MQVSESWQSPVRSFHKVLYKTYFDVKGWEHEFVSLDKSWMLDILLSNCYIFAASLFLPQVVQFNCSAVSLTKETHAFCISLLQSQ